ncbi:hypothetical protein GOV04_00280 [Candidatus Woesearchaeota archaeon]|nr:hypothetical protein [Candidatus Woesearchaeota archaeon]
MTEDNIPCTMCGKCCEYVCLQIDEPQDYDDFQNIQWYVAHKNVKVFVDDDDGNWYLQFYSPCKYLTDDKMCSLHSENGKDAKFDICKKHDSETCDNHGEVEGERFAFTEVDQVLKYMELKNIKKE